MQRRPSLLFFRAASWTVGLAVALGATACSSGGAGSLGSGGSDADAGTSATVIAGDDEASADASPTKDAAPPRDVCTLDAAHSRSDCPSTWETAKERCDDECILSSGGGPNVCTYNMSLSQKPCGRQDCTGIGSGSDSGMPGSGTTWMCH